MRVNEIFHNAAAFEDLPLFQFWIDKLQFSSATPELLSEPDEDGLTPAYYAVSEYGRDENFLRSDLVRIFIENGAFLSLADEIKDFTGYSVLKHAASQEDAETISQWIDLLKGSTKLGEYLGKAADSIAVFAVQTRNQDLLDKLLQNGANTHVANAIAEAAEED